MYAPAPPPTDPKLIAGYVRSEFERIAAEFRNPSITLKELHVEPAKPRDGMVCFFDGTDFDPGSGRGIYAYYGGAWAKLG